jgi:UrcA family protein
MTFQPLLGLGALLLALPAAAQRAEPVTTTVVRHADLDLTQPQHRDTLNRRVARAARAVCGAASPADLSGSIRTRQCRAEARARGMAQGDALAATAGPVEVAAH